MGDAWHNICDFPELTRFQSFKELIADAELSKCVKDLKEIGRESKEDDYEDLQYEIIKNIQDADLKNFNEEFIQL